MENTAMISFLKDSFYQSYIISYNNRDICLFIYGSWSGSKVKIKRFRAKFQFLALFLSH